MAYSFCWRYKCLPDGFSRSAFTATMTNLSRWNIGNMPGGVLYDTVIQSTPGVKVNVTGYAKDSSQPNLVINNLAGAPNPPNNKDWVIGTSRLPTSGLRSFDFVYTVSHCARAARTSLRSHNAPSVSYAACSQSPLCTSASV